MEKSINKEPLEKVIERRNKRLKEFFNKVNISIRIIGDVNSPAVIYNEKWCLSCYVHNFNLIFTDKPDKGNEIKRFKLLNDLQIDPKEISDIILASEHRKVYRIKLTDQDLYLSGYNFLDKEVPNTRYPVFAKYGSKVYFEKQYAQKIIEDYTDYNLVIV